MVPTKNKTNRFLSVNNFVKYFINTSLRTHGGSSHVLEKEDLTNNCSSLIRIEEGGLITLCFPYQVMYDLVLNLLILIHILGN